MTTRNTNVPPQGDRTPRGRRGEGTVPALSLSSSYDGLLEESPVSPSRKPAIAEVSRLRAGIMALQRRCKQLRVEVEYLRIQVARKKFRAKEVAGVLRPVSRVSVREMLKEALTLLFDIHGDPGLGQSPRDSVFGRGEGDFCTQAVRPPAGRNVGIQTDIPSVSRQSYEDLLAECALHVRENFRLVEENSLIRAGAGGSMVDASTGTVPMTQSSVGVQTEEIPSAPQMRGGDGLIMGPVSSVLGPLPKANMRGPSSPSGKRETTGGSRRRGSKSFWTASPVAQPSPPVEKGVGAGRGAGGKTVKSPRPSITAPPLGGASGGGGSLISGGRPARVKPARGLSSCSGCSVPPSGGFVGGGGSVRGGKPERVTPSPGFSSPSAAASVRDVSSSEEPPHLTIVVRVEEGGLSSPASAALQRWIADSLRGTWGPKRANRATDPGCGSKRGSPGPAPGRSTDGSLPRCYRCLGRGHMRWRCPCTEDLGSRCFGCGQGGHQVRQCANSAYCALCALRGLPAEHRAGSDMCPPVAGRRGRARARMRSRGHNGLDPPRSDRGGTRNASLGGGTIGGGPPGGGTVGCPKPGVKVRLAPLLGDLRRGFRPP